MTPQRAAEAGSRIVLRGVVVNALLAVVKVAGGLLGKSDALLADGLESALDIVSSALIWGALQVAGKPPDREHPYGHGKAESLAAVAGSIFLLGAGASVAIHSLGEIWAQWRGAHPASQPAPWTLLILVLVIGAKEGMFRILERRGEEIGSSSMKADAWHHRSDALTSIAAFLGIGVAVLGGEAWSSADDWAALFSCAIIVHNGARMLRASVGEVMDERVSEESVERVTSVALGVDGVSSAEKCRIRKSGLTQIADLHIRVDGALSVRKGHEISHLVKDRLLHDPKLKLSDVTVHIEPEEGA